MEDGEEEKVIGTMLLDLITPPELLDWVVVGLVIKLFDWLVSALFDCWLVVPSVIAASENGPARPWPP